MTSYQMRRHPFATGMILTALSPFILAAALLWVVAFVIAAALELVTGAER